MKAKIIEKKIISNKWGEYADYVIEYTRMDGRKEIQHREIQDNGNGSAVLLYNLEERKVILLKQFRLASMVNGNSSGVLIEVCAGLVENNDPDGTIKKEIKEELGLIINEVEYLYKGYATPGAKTEMIFFFAAKYDQNTERIEGGGLLSEQEDIELIELDFDSAYEMIKKEEIIDLKTISLLQYAKCNIFNKL